MEVPLIDLKIHNQAIKKEIFQLWDEIVDSASFANGKSRSSVSLISDTTSAASNKLDIVANVLD